ncbi:hypothetical protein LTR97_010801 [Elasticomyces elasticus]|uniref:Uncharacterized protein n=1 Tax=Elasticomyces elasticus TaxID=574655 RepID=A0AAN7W8T0_9PEZI|nr:hypothetical protein LTR97_010801 [Elasticomyces elasticus]
MRDLCDLVHGNTIIGVSGPKAAARIYKLAVVMDKYRCTQILDLQAQGLLLGYWDKHGQVALEEKRAAAQAKIAYGLPQLGMPICSSHDDESELSEAMSVTLG